MIVEKNSSRVKFVLKSVQSEQSYLKEEVYFLIKLTETFFHILITLQSSQILKNFNFYIFIYV